MNRNARATFRWSVASIIPVVLALSVLPVSDDDHSDDGMSYGACSEFDQVLSGWRIESRGCSRWA